jgi:hypothetical protein
MANYMEQVAKMLGLEWDSEKGESEVFELTGHSHEFKIALRGLCYFDIGDKEWYVFSDELHQILIGCDTIKKKPWKPKVNERYYVPDINDDEEDCRYTSYIWHDSELDSFYTNHNMVFRTKEEAIAKASEILKMLEVEE